MKFFLTLLLFVAIYNNSFGQIDSILKKAALQCRFERTFIRLNKQQFVNGERILFKIYLQYGKEPSAYSSSCRLDILNDDGIIIKTEIYPVLGSVVAGNFILPSDISTGRYFIKATPFVGKTNLKAYPHIFPVSIINPATGKLYAAAKYKKKIDLTVSYTGGGLLAGISNNFFVKINDQYHQPVKATVMLVENNRDTVFSNETNNYGNCAISIMPFLSASYHLVVKEGDKLTEGPLLNIGHSGVSVSAEHKDSSYYLNLFFTDDIIDKSITISGEQDFNLLFSKKIKIQSQSYTLRIPDSSLPSGIIRFVVTDSLIKSLGEVFVFSANTEALMPTKLQLVSGKTDSLQENHCSIEIADSNIIASTLLVAGNGGANDYVDSYPENIISRFLLTSFFKYPQSCIGNVSINVNEEELKRLNLLLNSSELLIPRWNDCLIIKNDAVETLPNDEFITVYGKLKTVNKKAVGFEGFLTKNNNVIDIVSASIADNGGFSLNSLIFFDSAEIQYSLKDQSGKRIEGDLVSFSTNLDSVKQTKNTDSLLFQYFTPVQYVDSKLSDPRITEAISQATAINEGEKTTKTLVGVTVTSKPNIHERNKEIENRYINSSLFRGDGSYNFNLITNPPNTQDISIMAYLRQTANGRDRLSQLLNGRMSLNGAITNETVFYLDEQIVTAGLLETIRVSEVAFVKCFWVGFITSGLNNGAIAIYTKKTEDRLILPNEKLRKATITGYSSSVEFVPDKKGLLKGNYPQTFLWLPSAPAKESIGFFSNKNASKPFFLIEGTTNDGRLIFLEQ